MYSIPQIDEYYKRQVESLYQAIVPRDWQKEALKKLDKSTSPIFVAEVCPGGGKTMFGCLYAASQLISKGKNIVVICLAPSISIKAGWKKTASDMGFYATENSDNFTEDVNFRIVTYAGAKQALKNIPPNSEILLIADEYHHAEREKEWGNALELISEVATKNLLLSGTPWRTDGYIALLKKHNRYGEDDKVIADYAYSYADDLISPTRGTVPLHFELLHSRAFVKEGGKQVMVSEYNAPLTEDDWEKASGEKPKSLGDMGKHINCDNVYKNETAIKILERVKERLEYSRRHHCPYAISLVVTRSKREADTVGRYLREKHGWTVAVIHSGTDEIDSRACKKITKIQDELKKRNPQVPEAIVSVGMISEGVDIPAIKVVGYLSAISTLLYIIQVIFRAARRIPQLYDAKTGERLTNPKYYDDSPTMSKAGYIIAPAEPNFVYVSANLKKDIKLAGKEKSGTDPVNDELLTDRVYQHLEYMTETDGLIDVINGWHIPIDVKEAILYLPLCPSIVDEFVTGDGFIQWVQAILDSSSDSSKKAVIERVRFLREKYAVEFSEVRRNKETPDEPSTNIDYDSQIAEVKSEINRLTNLIRWSKIKSPTGEPYADVDNDKAYAFVNRTINQKIGITTLAQSTLATRVKWIESARKFYEENING